MLTQYDNTTPGRFRRRSQARGLAFLAATAAVLLLILLIVVVFGTLGYRQGGVFFFLFLILAHVVSRPFAKLVAICWLRFKVHTSLDGHIVLANDPRPPVLYLRSFLVDDVLSHTGEIGADFFRTEEQQLERAFSSLGPLIAIGRPDDLLPPAGIPRLYVGDTWQETVRDLVSKAALILIGAGRGEGLRWEIELIIGAASPQRIVILLPFDKDEYKRFRASVADLFPQPLPDLPSQSEKGGGVRAALYFDANWAAHLVPFGSGRDRNLETECLRQLKPVYVHLNDLDAPARHQRRLTRRRLYLQISTATLVLVVACGVLLWLLSHP